MHILLTNDDGINSDHLLALANECIKRGHHITMVAPLTQRSANSHYVTISGPVEVFEQKNKPYPSFALDGTPADCTRIGIFNLVKEPVDLVISGINNGWNAGRAIIYSGTVGAAREALLCNTRAIATSIDTAASSEMIEDCASFTLDMAEKLCKDDTLPHDALLNINYPALAKDKVKAPVMAFVSTDIPDDRYTEYVAPRGQRYFFLANNYNFKCEEEGSDVNMLLKGHPALSFVSIAEDKTIAQSDFLNK